MMPPPHSKPRVARYGPCPSAVLLLTTALVLEGWAVVAAAASQPQSDLLVSDGNPALVAHADAAGHVDRAVAMSRGLPPTLLGGCGPDGMQLPAWQAVRLCGAATPAARRALSARVAASASARVGAHRRRTGSTAGSGAAAGSDTAALHHGVVEASVQQRSARAFAGRGLNADAADSGSTAQAPAASSVDCYVPSGTGEQAGTAHLAVSSVCLARNMVLDTCSWLSATAAGGAPAQQAAGGGAAPATAAVQLACSVGGSGDVPSWLQASLKVRLHRLAAVGATNGGGVSCAGVG